MNFPENNPTRQAAINGLAVTGFIVLIVLGVWLAVYSTRFVPDVANRVGTAAAYLGSVFVPAPTPTPTLSVVPNASTTISFDTESAASSTEATSTTPVVAPKPSPKPVATTAGKEATSSYLMSGTVAPVYSGLPDLIVTINAVGYLATSSADSFVASGTVPTGSRPAVSFTIKNIGTNVAGAWRFSASIPTQTAYVYASQPQQSLNPGDSIDYTLGFDQATAGANKMISITANSDHAIAESNSNNDSASATITILGN
ncbi:MAG: CARDB domain-containing protein [Minisyncoccota bacterium]